MNDLRVDGRLSFLGAPPERIVPADTKLGRGFAETIKESVEQVEQQQKAADQSINDLATGRKKTLHEVMISVEQADISFRMMMAVRGKIINAYQEVMRMGF